MKKGFTLVELIGVVVILGLIAAFSVPALTKTFKKTADKEYEEFVKNVTLAAENYFHSTTDGKIDVKKFISVKELKDNGYLKKSVNPLTNTDVSEDATIVITKNDNGTENYEFVDMNITEKGYVQDGLILHYDGYMDIVDGKVVDLSNNMHDGSVTGVIKESNYYYFDNSSDIILSDFAVRCGENDIISSSNLAERNGLTIEVSAKYDSGNYLFKTDAGTTSKLLEEKLFNGSSANFLTTGKAEVKTLNYYIDNDMNKSLTTYLNGNVDEKSNNVVLNDGTYISIGANSGSANMKIYSVRIYDRSLTDSEVKQNYMVDKYRFGIGA